MKKTSCKRGFTLIELLVVVLIIGILAAVAVPQYTKAVEKSRVTEALLTIKTMQQQIELYLLQHGLPAGNENEYVAVQFPDMTSADLGLDWDSSGDYYVGKHFDYSGWCDSERCVVRATGEKYSLYSSTAKEYMENNGLNYTTQGGWCRSCVAFHTDMGKYICKSIENQGWGYEEGGD